MADLIRKQLGLTQERLAWWLGVTREQVGQIELGRRGLPIGAGFQDIRLGLAVMGLVPHPTGATPPQPAPPPLSVPPVAPKPLTQRLAYCRYHAQRLRLELDALRIKATAYETRLKALPALRAWTGPVPASVNEANWLRIFEGEAVDGLRLECGAGPQRLLAIRIAGLEREAELLEEALRELPEPGAE